MSEQNFKWLFTLLPFVLSFLMRCSGTASLSNPIYMTLKYCEYGVMIFWILAIGFHIGIFASDKNDKTFSTLKEECLKEIGYKFAKVQNDYIPMKEEISRLKTLLEQVERRERYYRQQFEQTLAHSRRTPEDANKAALASVTEV